jgi:prolipoprotein diacylglyceryl transferase
MLTYPEIDPVIFTIGPLAIRWYGLMYVLGFVGGWMLALRRSQQKWSVIRPDQVDDLIFYCMLGVILGGRIGYCIFYGWEYWLQDPLYVFKITQGGMSFHGGLIGVMIAMWLYGRLALGKGMWQVTDFVAPLAPIGLGTGRIGNFINGELWGSAARGSGPFYHYLGIFSQGKAAHGGLRIVPCLLRHHAILHRVCTCARCRFWLPCVGMGYDGTDPDGTDDLAWRCTFIAGLQE